MFQPDELNAPVCADFAVKQIIENGAKILYHTYLHAKIPLYTADDIVYWNHGVIE
jgi:hypothetical protein